MLAPANIRWALLSWGLVWFTGALGAQPLSVYSEFARIDAAGRVVSPESPREILSPALARNAFTSFQIVVEVPADKSYFLHVGQNPENAVKVTMYRETGDRLDPVELPVSGKGTQIFWMDLWTDKSAPVARIKVEPQLSIDDDWVIYPMEGRVMDALVPDAARQEGFTAPFAVMKGVVCGTRAGAGTDNNRARLQYRNAQQDAALASKASKEELRKAFGSCDAAAPTNPEAYLKIRDYLFRLR
jgi:hypothetical protein